MLLDTLAASNYRLKPVTNGDVSRRFRVSTQSRTPPQLHRKKRSKIPGYVCMCIPGISSARAPTVKIFWIGQLPQQPQFMIAAVSLVLVVYLSERYLLLSYNSTSEITATVAPRVDSFAISECSSSLARCAQATPQAPQLYVALSADSSEAVRRQASIPSKI